MSTTAQEIAEVPKEEKPKTLAELIRLKKPQYQQLLPAHISPDKFLRIIFTQIQKNPKLLKCTQASIFSSIVTAAEMGLVPDGRKGALVPFYNKTLRALESQFIPMYQGLIELARNSGEIADIFAATVHENDEYNYELGLNRDLTHRPKILGDRGKAIAYYCVVELLSGAKTFGSGPMTVAEVEEVKKRVAAQNGPWVTDFGPMALKTVIKRVLKYCPQSSELAKAIEIDNDFSLDDDVIDIDAVAEQINDTDELNETIGKIAEEKKNNPKEDPPKTALPESSKVNSANEPDLSSNQDKPPPNKVSYILITKMIKDAKTDDDLDVALDLSNSLDNPVHKQQAQELAIERLGELQGEE